MKNQGAHFVLVSDGPFHHKLQVGASAWVIARSEGCNIQLHGENIIPGPVDI